MGTSMANLHILDGDILAVNQIVPNASVFKMSERFVSVYAEEFETDYVGKHAKSLSKKLSRVVLSAWIFDSDDVSFAVYENGKKITEHIDCTHSGQFAKAGNIPLFCEKLGLPKDDEKRLRALWMKGRAEDKFYLTASLLGLPLFNDHTYLPEKPVQRDSDIVDKWIKERPEIQKIKSETKPVLVEEKPTQINPYDIIDYVENFQLPDGGEIVENSNIQNHVKFTRLNKNKLKLWSLEVKHGLGMKNLLGFSDEEILFSDWGVSSDYNIMYRHDTKTGELIKTSPLPFIHQFGTRQICYNNGSWWAWHLNRDIKTQKFLDILLTKYDKEFNILGETALPSNVQEFYFSPENDYLYVFIFENQVLVVNTETITIENVLVDKTFLKPWGFDNQHRFWIQRGFSTAEAWDKLLTKPLSRHKLKGEIFGLDGMRTDKFGVMCATTWKKDKAIKNGYNFNRESGLMRLYRFE